MNASAWLRSALLLIGLLAGCTQAPTGSPTVHPAGSGVPTPASDLAASFVEETDPNYAFRLLRPAGWDSIDDSFSRAYTAPGLGAESDHLTLRATNYRVTGERVREGGGALAQYGLFEENPDLESWSQGLERMWAGNGHPYERLESGEDAAIYALNLPNELLLIALKVDGGEPLSLALTGRGAYTDFERVQAAGLYADFRVMAASLAAAK
ncbi:MAG TPA: hypothetical protein VFF68_13775 [Anaerolineaceae bacterium]|nr:hypothetical protein [Anaerolineaceae bacterium]